MVKRSRLEIAEAFLRAVLARGPVAVTKVMADAEATGEIAPKTLLRAKAALGVVARKSRAPMGAWSWELPSD